MGRSFVAVLGALVLAGLTSAAAMGAEPTSGHIRVDQLGYRPNESKVAYLLGPTATPGVRFRVIDAHGAVVLRGSAGASRGAWNDSYPAVHPLDLTGLDSAGRYRVVIPSVDLTSPWFTVAPSAALFGPRIADAVAFFRAQRDGADVIPGSLDRQPSHLNDENLRVYEWPTYDGPDSDVIVGDSLTRLDGTVDLTGGWFDAGDFIKFTHTTAYAVGLMYASMRELGSDTPAALATEARFGQRWLERAWDADRGILYLQVGIGSGNEDGTFFGDHDLWRLPEEDDSLTGDETRYLRRRPAFRANDPGAPLPPNLAGRMAAAFALAAQVDAGRHPARARRELETAAAIFAAAKRHDVVEDDIATALPHAFYPESSWRDDMEWASAELALAGQALDDARTAQWIRQGARLARQYLDTEAGSDTFNVYDTSALAHADMVRAIRAAGHPDGLAIDPHELINDLRAQLGMGASHAAGDPFRAGSSYDGFDVAPHLFGHIVTVQLYRDLTGDGSYDDFGTQQRDWLLGSNAWGVSLMIGVGSRFPECPQHVVANLSGSLDGRPPYLRGAVVNGPNDASLFADGLGGFFSEGQRCPPDRNDRYEQYTARGSRFVDDVRAWQTVEPAIDFTAAALYAFALLD